MDGPNALPSPSSKGSRFSKAAWGALGEGRGCGFQKRVGPGDLGDRGGCVEGGDRNEKSLRPSFALTYTAKGCNLPSHICPWSRSTQPRSPWPATGPGWGGKLRGRGEGRQMAGPCWCFRGGCSRARVRPLPVPPAPPRLPPRQPTAATNWVMMLGPSWEQGDNLLGLRPRVALPPRELVPMPLPASLTEPPEISHTVENLLDGGFSQHGIPTRM